MIKDENVTYYSIREASGMMSRSVRTLRWRIQTGRTKAIKCGRGRGKWYIPESEIIDFGGEKDADEN